MEDKSPLYPNGAEFKAPDTELDEKQPEKKKKKNRFAEFIAKLLPKEPTETNLDKSPESDGKTNRFIDSLKNLFSPLTGVEKEEVEDSIDTNEEEAQFESSELRFPLLGNVDYEERDETDTNTTLDSVEAYSDPIDRDGANTALADTEVITDAEQPSDLQKEEDPNSIAEPLERPLSKPTERPDEGLLYVQRDSELPEISYHERPEQTVITERETVIEQRGGGGAALLGAIVANRLSKSRDEKLRQEANELKEHVDKLQEEQALDTQGVEDLRAKSKSQAEELRNKRQSAPEESNPAPIDTTLKTPIKYQSIPEVQKTLSPEKVKGGAVDSLPTQETREVAGNADPVVTEQIEKAAEQDVALERYYEKRHEVKDVPSAGQQTGGGANIQSTTTNDDYFATQRSNLQRKLEAAQKQAQPTTQLYKDAIQRGLMAGIILLVSFLLVVLLWGLLN